MQLKQKTENIWNTNKLDVEFSTRKLGKKIIDMEYFHNVIFPTNTMMMHTESFVDPTVFKSPTFLNSFKSGCEFGSKAPKELLKYLSLRIVKFCTDAITENEIILLNYKRSYLLELSGRFNVSARGYDFPDVGKYLKKFLILFEKLGNTSALEFNDIEMMNKNFPDFDSAFDAYFTELSLKNSINIDDEEPHDL
uniref:Uncharacterized protein n=1 Tax=Meloidogyne enterolobii TaxID=390850 RepID=A0A6V7WUM9_MELEN|nr:unnamed protein product [Meloidogyne enterolobii]